MDLVFCGTPQFAVPTLEKLVEAGHRVRLVICQPDRPSGRGQPIKAPEVKQRAVELKLPVIQPPSIKNNAELRAKLEDLTPEAIIVVAYGRLIPKWMLDLARILKREDGRLDFSLPAAALVNRLRGFQPWPGAYTRFRGKHLQILAARVAEGASHLTAGELLAKDQRLLVGCDASSVMEITKSQVEGKKPMQAGQFVNGYRPRPGEKLGQAESGG